MTNGRCALRGPFLMYTGAIDHRKNIEGLIRAGARLAPALRRAHQLAIVCAVQPHHRSALEQLAHAHGLAGSELVLTGFVAEDDLARLYNLCTAFVFPSWHEGFGLPALEAMACGRAVIGANTSSVPEVIGRGDALFDPHDEADMAERMAQVLGDAAFRAQLEHHGLERPRRFSWEATADRALQAMLAWHARRGPPTRSWRRCCSTERLRRMAHRVLQAALRSRPVAPQAGASAAARLLRAGRRPPRRGSSAGTRPHTHTAARAVRAG